MHYKGGGGGSRWRFLVLGNYWIAPKAATLNTASTELIVVLQKQLQVKPFPIDY